MFKVWSATGAELLDFSDALGFGPKREVKKTDNGISTKINRELNRLAENDPRSTFVAEQLVKIAGKYGERFTAQNCKDALLGNDHQFLSFLSKYCVGAPAGDERASAAERSRSNARESDLGDELASLAPLTSSQYVGIRWPYTNELSDHFGATYRAIFGTAFPRKTKPTPQEQIFFFYRLGFEGWDRLQPSDGTIHIQDEQLRLVIRRVPARICYEDPFDEWLTYEEAYYNEREERLYTARGVLYGFNGGMTLLCRDETAKSGQPGAVQKKLALAHFDFNPALDHQQTTEMDRDAHALRYYTGSIAMESDINPKREQYFATTAYRCLLRKAPNGTKWDEVKAQESTSTTPKQIGKSATKHLGIDCGRKSDGTFDLDAGEQWGKEDDLMYTNTPYEWRWYFDRLNINTHAADLFISGPSVTYRRLSRLRRLA
jgi:hypothetical protein